MKQSKFLLLLLGAAMTFFLISCGSGEEKKSSESTSTDTAAAATTTTTEPAPVNTVITRPQNMVVVRHKVANFAKWMAAYDAHDSARLADGLHSYVISRGEQKDSNIVQVAMKADDLAKAKAFVKDPGLKKAMQKGGVVGAPMIKFYTMVFQDTAVIDSKLRAASIFKVKDWATWQKAFDSTRALKTDNGLMPRAYGYDPDDNHNVVIVSAILDTAKAHAYWNSDMLKQRRAAGGVVGKPERFEYTIVKLY
ncbi:MAG TPA: hypothetical protein VFD24_09855 [Chitinophagaceae bacterium]|jgi:hypothetical protein|nr:hypothetical protein [Chitinophagaceae bacterium]